MKNDQIFSVLEFMHDATDDPEVAAVLSKAMDAMPKDMKPCDLCGGSGIEYLWHYEGACPECKGAGNVEVEP